MRTLQEKYNAILEGNFSKEQFRRDATMQLPNLVSKFNSFEDTVNILKNKGMIAEAKMQTPKYSTVKPEDTIAPDVLDTGIKFELDKKYGTLDVTDEQYTKCREMAIKNLANDVLYYVKQDSIQLETPGEKMEKVTLKEGKAEVNETVDRSSVIAAVRTALKGKYTKLEDRDIAEFLQIHLNDFMGEDPDVDINDREDIVHNFEIYVYHNEDSGDIQDMIQRIGFFPNNVDQMEEGKSIELSAEDMEKLHKDGKITLPDGSVLHFAGKVAEYETPKYSEEELAQFTKDQIEHDEETLRRERGLEERQLKETIKKIIAKVITE